MATDHPYRFVLLLTALSLLSRAAVGQSRPEGIYASAQDWWFGNVDHECHAHVAKVIRTAEGYELYKMEDEQGRPVKGEHWALVMNDTLYMWYDGSKHIRVQEQGRLCYFKGPPYVSDAQQQLITDNIERFGLIGAAITSSDVQAQARGKIHYVVDVERGKVYPLSFPRLRILLAGQPGLLAEYERSSDPENLEVMLGFLRRANSLE